MFCVEFIGNLVAMESYTGAQRAFCVRAYYQNNNSIITARRLYRAQFNLRDINLSPSANVIRKWIKTFEATGSTMKGSSPGRPREVRVPDVIQEAHESARQDSSLSLRKRSQALNIKKSTLHLILKKDLHLRAYKIQLVQELKPSDYEQRLNFVQEMLARFATFDNILFSDEANFHLNGHVNKQNCRYWSQVNPRHKHMRPLHSPKVVVWAAMSAKGIIGPYFFEDGRGHALTVNTDRYCDMIRTFLAPSLQEFSGYNSATFFQQDGARCHTTDRSIGALNELFPGKLMSLRGNIKWPPRSPDLSPLDYFLWGYLKSKVYKNKPTTLTQLKTNIVSEIGTLTNILCKRVVGNLRSRLEECQSRNGRHLDNIIFGF